MSRLLADDSGDGIRRRGRRPNWFGPRVRIAAAGYVAVAIFAVAAGIALTLGSSVSVAAGVGALFAAPVVIALVGERVTGIKGFGLEVSLEKVTVEIASPPGLAKIAIHTRGTDGPMPTQEAAASGFEDLAGPFRSLIEERSQLLRINLRDDSYWWSTRLFLVAALAQDLTDVQALVFVRSGDDQLFVGIASPRAVRTRMNKIFPAYEVAYRDARTVAIGQWQEDVLRPSAEVAQMLEFRWRNALAALEQPESQIWRPVASGDLQDWLGGDLDTRSFSDGPLSSLQQYRILSHDRPYAALTSDRGRLESVVSRAELGASLSMGYLERKLGG